METLTFMYTSWPGARRWLLVDPALRTQRSTLDWSPERKEHERLRQREFSRLRRLEDDRRMAARWARHPGPRRGMAGDGRAQ